MKVIKQLYLYLSESYTCNEQQIQCAPGHCLPIDLICDGMFQCENGTDELNCGK